MLFPKLISITPDGYGDARSIRFVNLGVADLESRSEQCSQGFIAIFRSEQNKRSVLNSYPTGA
jgi:hypothetical protein